MFYRLLFIVMLFLSSQLSANDLKNIKTFDADFKQTIINSSNKTIVYKGHIYIKEPGKILWQYKDPIIKNVYVFNKVAVIDEPELEQAIYSKLQNEVNILELMETAKKIANNKYRATLYNVTYTISIQQGKIKSIVYVDELENKVMISFENIKQNEIIEDKVFEFIPPKYYDIIRK